MPHLRIEYSRGLARRADIGSLCAGLHRAMVATGIFPLAGIRVRAFAADHAIVADGLAENDFAALTLTVGAGRRKAALAEAGATIMGAAEAALAGPLATPHFALSLEIRVADPDLSWKNTPIHARLSGKG
ncbi:5-carboxymethyl-2-hydroxymuconate Delta-isomerase [Paracoccus sediminicola]|uniref:5-carboxymethyl-2-hydroxymuconate Delta-isomerase n=1 Tax=Paracoccus sediminicola TaxID=3017783 RepID=UPI0022F05685|nr:5-carboxymethyl-2-hydroxymuconate Delta-isomerase [Paracoccus sediminicola]WBU57357.1 5-carboxymethyl-2-hydroxymuconate isomerase [Paracoccus sediminicola]